MISKFHHVDDLLLMSESMRDPRISSEYGETFEGKRLKANLVKSKLFVSGSITKDDLSKRKEYPRGVCILRVNVNSV